MTFPMMRNGSSANISNVSCHPALKDMINATTMVLIFCAYIPIFLPTAASTMAASVANLVVSDPTSGNSE